MKERKFLITGLRPVYGRDVNEFIKRLDLGTNGAFIKFSEIMTAVLEDDITQEQLNRQPYGIEKAYEHFGCINVVVVPLDE